MSLTAVLQCHACGQAFTPEDRTGLHPDVYQFCSWACVREHLFRLREERDPYRRRALVKERIRQTQARPGYRPAPGTVRTLLPTGAAWVRSSYEAVVYPLLYLIDPEVKYEPVLQVTDDSYQTRIYIPDFALPNIGVFIEVKGPWRLGAKRLFEAALKQLGPDMLVLVPSHLVLPLFPPQEVWTWDGS